MLRCESWLPLFFGRDVSIGTRSQRAGRATPTEGCGIAHLEDPRFGILQTSTQDPYLQVLESLPVKLSARQWPPNQCIPVQAFGWAVPVVFIPLIIPFTLPISSLSFTAYTALYVTRVESCCWVWSPWSCLYYLYSTSQVWIDRRLDSRRHRLTVSIACASICQQFGYLHAFLLRLFESPGRPSQKGQSYRR